MKGVDCFLEPPQLIASICALVSAAALLLAASYEATFAVLSRSTLEKLAENGTLHGSLMLRVYEPRQRLRLMTRIGTAAGIVGLSLSAMHLVDALFQPYVASGAYATVASALLTVGLFALLSVPRRVRFADEDEEPCVPFVALAFVPFHSLLAPVVDLLEHITSADYTDEDFRAEKEEELRNIVESESESGVIEEGEREMIQGVFGFHDRVVREVMVPRVDIQAIESTAPLSELLDLIRETGHSRVPVYEETLDHISGIVYAKDLLQLLVGREGLDLKTTTITELQAKLGPPDDGTVPLLHAPHYVPETRKIDALLHDMRVNKIRLSVVFDEYGGTAGLVSTEDLVEEIVGDIQDEYDDEEELFYWLEPEDTLVANARIDIDDLNEMLETDLPNEGFETLGGFIFDHLGSIPQEGQVIETENLEIKILRVEGQRISQVQIRRLVPAEKEVAGEQSQHPA